MLTSEVFSEPWSNPSGYNHIRTRIDDVEINRRAIGHSKLTVTFYRPTAEINDSIRANDRELSLKLALEVVGPP
jgi:hypothetical protein